MPRAPARRPGKAQLSLTPIRFDDADPLWPDRDRVLRAPDGPAMDMHAAQTLHVPPGLAFGAALGLALAERLLTARFGRSLVDHRTWLLAGPAELAAGTAHEAACIAGALTLGRLTVLAAVPESDLPHLARFTAIGWSVRTVPEGAPKPLEAAISAALRGQKPSLIAILAHAPDQGRRRDPIGLGPAPTSPGVRRAWLKRLRRHAAAAAFHQAIRPTITPRWHAALAPGAADPTAPEPWLQAVLARVMAAVPELAVLPPLHASPPTPATDALHSLWSYRPAAMSAALFGMALHGGLVPVGRFDATALDTIGPATRAAAAHDLRLLHILTGAPVHDTAMPPPHCPATQQETRALLEHALRRAAAPSALLLPPQLETPA